jgi:hypothetical protein
VTRQTIDHGDAAVETRYTMLTAPDDANMAVLNAPITGGTGPKRHPSGQNVTEHVLHD